MVRKILFLLPLLCCAILPQKNGFIRLITSGDFDARNPFIYKDEFTHTPPPIFFELHKDGYSNIYSVAYNSASTFFEDTVALTFGTDLNINPAFESYTGLLYQTNKNGNWDIALLPDSNGNWGTLTYLANSSADETEPKYFETFNFSTDSANILFRRNGDIVYLKYKQDQTDEEVIFQNTNEFMYNEFIGLELESQNVGLYVFAIEQDNNNQKRIVRKFKPRGENWREKTIVKDNCDCSDLSLQITDYVEWTLFYSDSLQGERRYFIIDPIAASSSTLFEIDYSGNLSGLTAYSLLIVGKKFNKEKFDPPFYTPYTYSIENNGMTKVRIDVNDLGYWYLDSLVQVSVVNPNLAVGPVGLDNYGLVVYTVWEDSIDGHIQLFGTPTHLGYGDVKIDPVVNDFILYQNYPNSFNPSTNIPYAIDSRQFVTLKVYDVLGKEIATLVNEEKEAGMYNVRFSMNNLPAGKQGLSSGFYFYKLEAGSFVASKKMILLK